MSLKKSRKRRKLFVAAFLVLTLVTVLISCLQLPWKPPPGGGEHQIWALKGHTFPVQVLTFGPDGATLTSIACFLGTPKQEMEVATWNVGTGDLTTKRVERPGALRYLALAPSGRRLAASDLDRTILLWDLAPWRERRRLEATHRFTNTLAISDEGTRLATIANANEVMLWDVNSGTSRACGKTTAGVASLAFAPGGTLLAIGVDDSTIRLWNPATGKELHVLRRHVSFTTVLTFSPDGGLLAGGDYDGGVTLWEVATGGKWATLETTAKKVLSNELTALTFAPDGRMLAVAVGRVVQLWDVASSRLVARLEGHEGKVICLAFSPDGTRLASGSYDQTVRLWDMARYRVKTP
jgi:WD40 repeat protein